MPANTQNDYSAIILDYEPKKKATALVKEVIVIEGPACEIPISIRLTTGKLISV